MVSPFVTSVPPNRYQEEQRRPPLRRACSNLSSLSGIVVQSFRPITQVTDTIQRLLTQHSKQNANIPLSSDSTPSPTLIPCEADFQVFSAKSGFRRGKGTWGRGYSFTVRNMLVGFFSNLQLVLENTFVASHNCGEKGANIGHLKSVAHSSCLSPPRRKMFGEELGLGHQELAPSLCPATSLLRLDSSTFPVLYHGVFNHLVGSIRSVPLNS